MRSLGYPYSHSNGDTIARETDPYFLHSVPFGTTESWRRKHSPGVPERLTYTPGQAQALTKVFDRPTLVTTLLAWIVALKRLAPT